VIGLADMGMDFDKMELFSKLLGQTPQEGFDLGKTMEMVQKIQGVMGLLGSLSTPKEGEKPMEDNEKGNLFAMSRPEKMVHAAIPFLDDEYQKNVFISLKLLEIQRVVGNQDTPLESRSKQEENPKKRRIQMLRAMQPYLEHGEKGQLDRLVKVMEVEDILR